MIISWSKIHLDPIFIYRSLNVRYVGDWKRLHDWKKKTKSTENEQIIDIF